MLQGKDPQKARQQASDMCKNEPASNFGQANETSVKDDQEQSEKEEQPTMVISFAIGAGTLPKKDE